MIATALTMIADKMAADMGGKRVGPISVCLCTDGFVLVCGAVDGTGEPVPLMTARVPGTDLQSPPSNPLLEYFNETRKRATKTMEQYATQVQRDVGKALGEDLNVIR